MSTIKLRLRELLAQRESRENRRIRLAEISQATGVSVNTLTALVNDQSDKISLPAIASLCTYFHCMPGDLFQLIADESEDEDAVDARDIVHKWHREYGSDEHPPE
jgi:putative transcriptional regulator